MQCERCQKKPANVHITQYINGQKTEKHLCEQCAKEEQVSVKFPKIPLYSLNDLLGVFFNEPLISKKEVQEDTCPNCQVSYRQIAELGRMGCSECYGHFSSYLEPALRKMHGATIHRGKIPQRLGTSLRIDRELSNLKHKLRQAVEKEEYEKAAVLRDQIKELERKNAEGQV
ncbi:MAG TPA: hypothetical protein GX532_01895 [Clostridia bacterium]|jgi:protein arginine kinase activator|nr:UvrB/UvrC motif-containing protein [Clostridia bacterium]HHY05716.1 hypothetical protein [Clostridia bacterium]